MIDNNYSVNQSELNPEKGFFGQLKEDISCVFERDPAARNRFEVFTTYPGLHALIFYRMANRLWNRGFHYTARLISFIARLITNIDIHPGATIGRRFFIDHGAGVVIGETAIIGNDVTLYHGVTLGGTTWNKGRRHPILNDGVMVGAGAKVLGAITLGKGVRIGANSVVVANVPDGKSVIGIPGRIVSRDSEVGEQLNGIDLNHHLIPDPVGKAISCLIERIDMLERQINHKDDGCSICGDGCDLTQFDQIKNKVAPMEVI